jgi:pimeloyl-ACP methyl ester carboxylesterase
LPRVIRYLCLADNAPKTLPPPHDYGVVLMLRASIPRLVPADQAGPLDSAVVKFLDGSSAESTDKAESDRLFAEALAAERALPQPARDLMHAVNTRDVAMLGRLLAPFAEAIGGDPALSPARSPATPVPVFLLHGSNDNVIPAGESPLLAQYLATHGNTRVDMLLTPLLTHADARPSARMGDMWRLITFWTRMWRGFERG